jgi:hypothetical protein
MAVLFVPAHLAFAVAVQAVGIDDEHASAKVVAGATEFAEGDLQLMGVGDGMGVEEKMDGDIGGDKGKSIGQFEAALPQAAAFADAGDAEGGLVDQLQGESRLDASAGPSGPAAEEVPSAEAKMFGDEQPQADEVAAETVGEGLADAGFDGGGIARAVTADVFGGMGFDRWERSVGTEPKEFFFEGRSRR